MLGLGCLCRLGHSVRGRWPHGRWYTGELGPFPRRKKIPCSSSFPQRRGTGRDCEGILELYSRADGILNDVASNKSRKYTSFHSHDHRGYISIRSYVQEKKVSGAMSIETTGNQRYRLPARTRSRHLHQFHDLSTVRNLAERPRDRDLFR